MAGLESSGKRSASQSAPIDIPAAQQGEFGEYLDPRDFVLADSSVGPTPTTIVADSNMKTVFEVEEGSSFSGFSRGSLSSWSSIKRSLFLSLIVLQVPAPIRNEASNEAEDALVIHRDTGLPVVPLLIMGRRHALQLPNDTAQVGREQGRRLGEELRGLGDAIGRGAPTARRGFRIPTGRTGRTAAGAVFRHD